MSTIDLIARAPSPKHALAVLAKVIDEQNEQLAELTVRLEKLEAGDAGWDAWEDDAPHITLTEQDEATERAQEALAPVRGGQEGIMPDSRPPMGNVRVEETSNGPVFVFPEPDESRRQQRALLERQQLKLALAVGDDVEDSAAIDWTAAYVKGGPWWLYQHRRDLVMSYDVTIRKRMVADVEQDSPRLAYEMSLDVLKEAAGEPDLETGAGALAVSNLTSEKAKKYAG